MTRRLGWVQRDVLTQIARQSGEIVAAGEGRALYTMLGLRGTAAKYTGRYVTSVTRAIERHNTGTCGDDCPVPRTAPIAGGAVGPRGGFGYHI